MLLFHERVLGFACDYVGGNPPGFAIVSRDELAIVLRRVAQHPTGRPNEAWGGTWDVFFWARGVDALAAEFRDAGADIVYGPQVKAEYGMREFAVRDPVGYVLGFGEELGCAGGHA